MKCSFFFLGGGGLRATFLIVHLDLSQVEFYSHLIGCSNMNFFSKQKRSITRCPSQGLASASMSLIYKKFNCTLAFGNF